MTGDETEALREEVERARRRIAELEARLVAEIESRKAPPWLYTTLDTANVGVWDWDITLDKVTWTDSVYRAYGETRESFRANLDAVIEATLEEDRAHLGQKIEHTLATGEPYYVEYRIRRTDGAVRWISAWGQASFDGQGKAIRLAGTAIDITDRKREEAEKIEMQQRMIDAQRVALRALGAPILPLANHTLATPLIGELTDERIAQWTEVLLSAVRDASAQVVLLDMTGVPDIDTVAAEGLIKTGHAVRLLGAQMVLTGVRPQVARILVELGVELKTFVLKATLQAGIEYATRLQQSITR